MAVRVEVARTFADVERLAPLWDAIPWRREEAEREYLLARVRLRTDAVAPFGAIAHQSGRPLAALAGRFERRQLPAMVGYRTLYAPRVRVLQLVDGGIVAEDTVALGPLLDVLRTTLASGEVDAIAVPPLPVDSPLYRAFSALGGPLERQPFVRAWLRRLLVLPDSFDEFVASRSRKIRFGIRYDTKRLLDALGDDLAVEIVRDPSGLDRFVHDADTIASTTYQRAVGAGFADTHEQRELLGIALERTWARAYTLRHAGRPIAYWLCSTYGDTLTLRTTGYVPDLARHRVGIYLLLRVIEDACADPVLRVLDFGPGDAAYKLQFSSENHFERNLLVFAPTLRGRTVNLARGAILGGSQLARTLADAAGVTGAVRKGWRTRLRHTHLS
jgi:hypothetical protein